MPVLKLDKHDPQKELEFEVECALKESPTERLERWEEWNNQMLTWFEKLHGHEKTPPLIKRA